MQKRLLRLSTQIQIRQQITGFVGKKINIVLNDNTVVLVELLRFSEAELWVQNMRGQKLSVPFRDIYEIIIDIND
jgi:hypothetical protein